MSSIPQRLIIGIEKPYIDSPAQNLLKKYSPGGIILFDRNGTDPGQLKELIDTINGLCEIRPFIGIDFEGGRVRRMKALFSDLQSPADYDSRDFGMLRRDCLRVAEEFRRYGINLNFAPVGDLGYEPLNPALKGRVYSNDCLEAAEYCRVFVEAFDSGNIMCCLKHFPGLGSAANDPHDKISVNCLPVERILNNDLMPFKAGIDAGAAMIMTSHALVSSIDNRISTFSKPTAKLARSTGFKGLLVTDDMSMGAVKSGDLSENVLAALACGYDMALICKDFEKYDDLIINLEKNAGFLVKNGHDESIARIANAKKKYFKNISPA